MSFAHNKQAINFNFSRQGRWEVLANVLYLMKLGHVTNRTSILQNLVLSLKPVTPEDKSQECSWKLERHSSPKYCNAAEPRFAAYACGDKSDTIMEKLLVWNVEIQSVAKFTERETNLKRFFTKTKISHALCCHTMMSSGLLLNPFVVVILQNAVMSECFRTSMLLNLH